MYAKTYLIKQFFLLIFLFKLNCGVCKHKMTILSYRIGPKLSSKLLFVSSLNIDGF